METDSKSVHIYVRHVTWNGMHQCVASALRAVRTLTSIPFEKKVKTFSNVIIIDRAYALSLSLSLSLYFTVHVSEYLPQLIARLLN